MIGFFIASFVRVHPPETVQNKTSKHSSLNLIEKTNKTTTPIRILPKNENLMTLKSYKKIQSEIEPKN
jgi:hypothetical protein